MYVFFRQVCRQVCVSDLSRHVHRSGKKSIPYAYTTRIKSLPGGSQPCLPPSYCVYQQPPLCSIHICIYIYIQKSFKQMYAYVCGRVDTYTIIYIYIIRLYCSMYNIYIIQYTSISIYTAHTRRYVYMYIRLWVCLKIGKRIPSGRAYALEDNVQPPTPEGLPQAVCRLPREHVVW